MTWVLTILIPHASEPSTQLGPRISSEGSEEKACFYDPHADR